MNKEKSTSFASFQSDQDSDIFKFYSQFISSTYPAFLKRLGLNKTAIKAEGATITDSKGKTYIDCVAGYGLFNLGHNHPFIIQTLINQLKKKQQFTRPFITEPQIKLAKLLAEITPDDLTCSFLCNSGSEAIDSAIKLSRLCQKKSQIIAAENSFHGYTFGALSATGISAFKSSFEPLVPKIIHVPFNDSKALQKAITSDTAAILLEPIQHEAGIYMATKRYLNDVREICDKNDILFILDEIKTGLGKTGYMFACEYYQIVPDIMVVGKSLGGGLIPIGAIIGKTKYWKKLALSFPMSASSFAGNILACTAAISTIKILKDSSLIEDCAEQGLFLLRKLNQIHKKFPKIIKSVKGLGLLIGMETSSPKMAFNISKNMINKGVLIFQAFGNPSVLMVEPPLIITSIQINKFLKALKETCENIEKTDLG